MSAWKKQAVPLVFLEIGMNAVIQTNGHLTEIRRIQAHLASLWRYGGLKSPSELPSAMLALEEYGTAASNVRRR